MKVSDLFKKLSYGELSNLSLATSGGGTIEDASKPKIIEAANDALLRLYTRFVLCEKDVLVEMVTGITNYHLITKYAESEYDPEEEDHVPYPYIKDLGGEPFTGDVIKIHAVYDSLNRLLPLNDNEQALSVFTPQANVVQVPHSKSYRSLSILYQARHVELSADKPDQEIILPDVLVEALKSLIAAKIFSAMGTQEQNAKSQEHMLNYENLCLDAIQNDLVSTSISTTNSRFNKRGWI